MTSKGCSKTPSAAKTLIVATEPLRRRGMETYALLISPRAEAAFFAQTLEVAQAELTFVTGLESTHWQVGELHFLQVEAAHPDAFTRLSFVQGVFRYADGALTPLEIGPNFQLHPDFVWGEKYRGKTNETLTQLLINLALNGRAPKGLRLLDPMCGRGTTLLWAMRYGMDAVGVDQDATAIPEMRRALKKWTKLHRQKHRLSEGWVQKSNKAGHGKYLEFETRSRLRAITGDTTSLGVLVHRKTFDLIVSDIPYGIQHMGAKDKRNPTELVQTAAAGWASCLAPDGMMAIAFNSYMPKRDILEAAFFKAGLKPVETRFQHRMSESILRDVLLLKR